MMKNKIKKHHIGFSIIILIIVFILLAFFALPELAATGYETTVSKVNSVAESVIEEVVPVEKVAHVAVPEAVKAIYMSACVLGTQDFRQDLVDLIDETEVNSVMIDIKDFSGTISIPTDHPDLQVGVNGDGCKGSGVKEFIETLHEKGIYVIGRVTVFQDPLYTKVHPDLAVKRASDGGVWKDHKGLAFIEVGAKPYWDYILTLTEESYALGFDEINFDYVRFPSDGNMKDIYFPFSNGKEKKEALREFFQYLDKNLREGKDKNDRVITSADLFGMTTTNTDDLNIGQYLEYALPYFDYVAPMVYPSHYPNGWNGYANPNNNPYGVIYDSMSGGVERAKALRDSTTTPQEIRERVDEQQLRTWIQDFDYGGDYGPKEVREQIQATYDVGLTSWMIWAPSNRYTRGALLNE